MWRKFLKKSCETMRETINMKSVYSLIFIETRMDRERGDYVVVTEYPHSLNICCPPTGPKFSECFHSGVKTSVSTPTSTVNGHIHP